MDVSEVRAYTSVDAAREVCRPWGLWHVGLIDHLPAQRANLRVEFCAARFCRAVAHVYFQTAVGAHGMTRVAVAVSGHVLARVVQLVCVQSVWRGVAAQRDCVRIAVRGCGLKCDYENGRFLFEWRGGRALNIAMGSLSPARWDGPY